MSRSEGIPAVHHPNHLIPREHLGGTESSSHHHLSGAHAEIHHARTHGVAHSQHAHLQRHYHHADTAHHHLPGLALHHHGKDVTGEGHVRHAASGSHRSADSPNSTGFSQQLMRELGVPDTDSNRKFLSAWHKEEGGAHNNPFNTSKSGYGGVSFNRDGVKNYPSMEAGVQATAATIRLPAYRGILNAMKRGNAGHEAAQALVNSHWGTKGAVLHYV